MRRLLIMLFAAAALVACGRPGPGNFEKYTANENGIRQLHDYVQDGSNSMEERVGAFMALIEAGWALQTRTFLDGCKDRDELAVRLTDNLVGRLPALVGDRKKLAPVRDAAFIGLNRIPSDQRGGFQKRLAAWAFDGLKPDSTPEKVKDVVEPRILVNQISDLGMEGVDGAVLMIRHGFHVDKLANYVVGLKDPESSLKLLEAMKVLHAIPDVVVQFTHVVVIGKIRSPDAVNHLLDLASNEDQDPDVRAAAFNAATDLLEDSGDLKGDRAGVVLRLRRLLARKNADDRWSASRYLVQLEGFDVMGEVMDALKDDDVYPRAFEDPMKTMVDFCRQVVFKKGGTVAAWDVVNRLLKSSNRVHQTLGIICVKSSGEPSRSKLLKRLTRSRKALAGVLGEETTVGRLARNGQEGLAMMGEVDAARKAGKLTAKDAKRKLFIILVDLLDTGEDYRQAVQGRFERESKQ
ncbi:MAG: hypothetical protein ISR64_00575 [Deltaproteobacteria bacterium]|nr:hypothetical protein [Deltaproteobacteria bacterium]